MEIPGSKASEFCNVSLEKNETAIEDDVKVEQPNQSPHIGGNLSQKGIQSDVVHRNSVSESTTDAQNQENSHLKTNLNGNVIVSQSEVESAFDVNIAITELSSDVHSDINSSPSQLQNISLELSPDSIPVYDVPTKTSPASEPKFASGDLAFDDSIAPLTVSIHETKEHNPAAQSPPVNITSNTVDKTCRNEHSIADNCVKNEDTLCSPNPPSSDEGVTPQLVSLSLTDESSPAHSGVSQYSLIHLTPVPSATSPKNPPPSQISPKILSTPTPPEVTEKQNQLQDKLKYYESQVEQLKKALSQKDNTITLYQRENALLEKEKFAFHKEKELATREKESIVIKFATKEKSLIDAKKQKEIIEKQLADSRKEVKNISTKFHTLNDEKSRISSMLDEKCNEVKRFQKELEKQKAEFNNLEMKFKWNTLKLAQETEGKLAAEKKLDEERNAPNPYEEKANEKIKVQYEATAILLKHEIEKKDKAIEALTKENKQATEKINQLQESMSKEILQNTSLVRELECLRQEHTTVQNSYSEEMLNSAKLRGQLDELQVLRTQHTLNEDKINTLNENLRELEDKALDSAQDLEQLHAKEQELLSINKEMSEMIVVLQNDICLQTSKVKGIEAENDILKKEKLDFDTKYNEIETQLKQEIQQKNDERMLLTKHLSEKTKMYESIKVKLDNAQGDLDATKKKHSQVVKELHRELQKYKKLFDENTSASSLTSEGLCRHCQLKSSSQEGIASNHSRGSNNSRSDSESEAQSTTSTMNRDVQGPSKQHLVERILRLQQASARQTEKIDFLENHTMSLVAELQKKSKVVQYYMMRDQAGALTSSKSDQNKSELAKYGGVMSAIYSGIKGPNQSMTLELSLEINKKLQAVLEDTLLKNITLKENLDVLGLEVDKLTRKLAQLKS